MNTTTNSQVNTTNVSTSWAPGTSPYWGWNSYGIWNNSGNMNTNVNGSTSMNNGSMNNANTTDMNANGSMNSSNSYSAYNGTAVTALPWNVQTNFGKDFPGAATNQYTWNQYGDWFNTYYVRNGRMTQYFYDQRGNGYSLSLPVIETYVPEDVIDKALQKYGAHLYSIGMVKTAEGKSAYQIGLIDRGQVHNDYLNEDGSSVASVWRVDTTNMTSSSANAAMGDENMNMNAADTSSNPNGKHYTGNHKNNTSAGVNTSTDMQTTTGDDNMSNGKSKSKTKIQNSDGTVTKIKSTENKTKIKTKTTNGSSTTNQQ
ncbi:hypothetical protein [Flavisolibacter ginsenosidimutans]|nr:hypothetical protein [Flavisolibacter ginsenosidimutans]